MTFWLAGTFDTDSWLISEQATQSLARDIAANAPLGIREAKRVFDDIQHLSLEDGLAYSLEPRMALNFTEDFQEGLRAFAEKRSAVFRGN